MIPTLILLIGYKKGIGKGISFLIILLHKSGLENLWHRTVGEKGKKRGKLKEMPGIFSLNINPFKTELLALSSALCELQQRSY